MAGDWIKIEENMPEKPEVWEIAEMLGIDPDSVAGKLIRVWAWASRNCNADGVTSVTVRALLDRCAGVTGFAKAMEKCGWLRVENGNLIFPNFDKHNGNPGKSRALALQRVKRFRNADTVTKALPEKRREEKSIKSATSARATESESSYSEIIPTGNVANMLALESRVQGLRESWRIPLTHEEQKVLLSNSRCLYGLSDDDWRTLKDYLYAKLPEGVPGWQPRSRSKFIASIPDVFAYAVEWRRKREKNTAPRQKIIDTPPQTDEDKAALAAFLKGSR